MNIKFRFYTESRDLDLFKDIPYPVAKHIVKRYTPYLIVYNKKYAVKDIYYDVNRNMYQTLLSNEE